MKQLRFVLILGLGFFALVAQTLLFRDFLAAFEGSELGVGSFFGSWLLWVGLGAVAGRIVSYRWVGLTRHFELAVLLYIPAFLLQQFLITQARSLGGVSAYEFYPLGRMFAVSMMANAPVSFVTGLLFTLACHWWQREQALPPARVYMLEALGSFLGGITVTLLLAAGVIPESVFCYAALLLTATSSISWMARAPSRRSYIGGGILLILLAIFPLLVLSGFSDRSSHRHDRLQWSRLLSPEEFRGSLTTAQAKYLYGQREGQFVVVSWGGVSETLPNTEYASEVIAVTLSQHPTARNVLVIGTDSLGICLRLRNLPQLRDVVWLHPDPQYPAALLGVLPPASAAAARQVHVPGVEVRRYLRAHHARFDLILLNLPDPTTLVLNRYWTREFFETVRQSLSEGGVVCTRFTGAANYMGDERVYLGSSALLTLESVFRHVVLKPGDESWLIGSDADGLTTAPAELRDRFSKVEGGADVYPPAGLMSLYVTDRTEFQLGKYREATANMDSAVLLNRDQHPRSLFFSLLLSLRRTTLLSLARYVPILWLGGVWMAFCPIVVYGLLRLVYRRAPRGGRATRASMIAAAAFDGRVVVFATGMAGMSLSMVLMFLYQSRFGSLFLDIGLISSLFMFGSFAGSLLSARLVDRGPSERRSLLTACLLGNLVFLASVMGMPESLPRLVYALVFFGCGVFVGLYFPIGAFRLRAAGQTAASAGASLELLDHWGGALGALLCGWVLLPLLGSWLTLCVLTMLVGVNLLPGIVPVRAAPLPPHADWFDRSVRPAGYTLLGVTVSMLLVSHVVAAVQTRQEGQRVYEAALVMSGRDVLESQTAALENGNTLHYWNVSEAAEGHAGFVFSTESLCRGVDGYGGPIVMAAYVSRDGTLLDLRILRSRETPAYVTSLQGWLRDLAGHNIFRSGGLEEIDAVSGATMTAVAVVKSLEQAGPRFAAQALGIEADAAPPATPQPLHPQFVCLAVLLGLAVASRGRPQIWLRRGMLLVTLVLTGCVWNLQYSSQQVIAILSWSVPGSWLSGSFFLLLLVPLTVMLVGNVYCGYVCPFGALQELVGELRPRKLSTDPQKSVWRYGRAIKYLLLALVVALFALTRDFSILSVDPLLTVFSPLRDDWVRGMALLVIALSLVFRRFWCRNLCPAGAFLALLGAARILRRLIPPSGPARCDLGVRAAGELDCLFCDRCRHAQN